MGTFLGIDYPTWWYLVVGALFTGYAILDGFDLGAGGWHLFLRKEESRRIALNAVGPVWDGNEVWLVIGGGALFAGFPELYATLFSALYIPFMLFLAFLILRAVSIEFRGKEPMAWWRRLWDTLYGVSSTALGVLLGVVLGNVLQGIAMDADHVYRGSWLAFLNPYALLTGLTTQALFMVHGAIYLGMKTEGRLFARLFLLLKQAMLVFVLLFVGLTAYTLLSLPHLTDRFLQEPWLAALPFLAFLSIANVPRLINRKRFKLAFGFSSIAVALLLMVVAVELYPVLLISTLDPAWSLTVYNAASSEKALRIMLGFAAVGTPLVLGYTFFVYRTFYGKVRLDEHSY
ncbi:MAG TPA: cytochrome d ubiquinol oxidase subunit II [Flavobacteriales bacterium]|nr:cytochrome d ubiquinol oxidase subunit II [Flavobacteriales bacterium]HPQ59753.1 cytochrome d ubiquinol oxidase subunit II [Flavobacteriales bacterium]HRW90737.1 cytochrome d ubiquinol oxidase subunit II [Flavobacteriales bacterium]